MLIVRDSEKSRIIAKTAQALLEEGTTQEEEEEGKRTKDPFYAGGKWGGLYLRAPDIYFRVLEKGKDKLVRLGDVAEVRRGFTTGANDFFYLEVLPYPPSCPSCGVVHTEAVVLGSPLLDSATTCLFNTPLLVAVKNRLGWEGYLEANSVFPLAKDLDDLDQPVRLLVFVPRERMDLTHTKHYISLGEKQVAHLPTLRARKVWWSLSPQTPPPIVVPAGVGERYEFRPNPRNYLIDKRLYGAYPKEGTETHVLLEALNSTFFKLHMEVAVRKGLGGGLADFTVYEYASGLIPRPDLILESGGWERALGLASTEKEALTEALTQLIRERTAKAKTA